MATEKYTILRCDRCKGGFTYTEHPRSPNRDIAWATFEMRFGARYEPLAGVETNREEERITADLCLPCEARVLDAWETFKHVFQAPIPTNDETTRSDTSNG